MKYRYYKVTSDRIEYLGVRFFKVNYTTDTIVQVVVESGEKRRSKASNIGIYMISKITFYSNYQGMRYVEETTESEYNKAFKNIVKLLK